MHMKRSRQQICNPDNKLRHDKTFKQFQCDSVFWLTQIHILYIMVFKRSLNRGCKLANESARDLNTSGDKQTW